VSGDGSIHGLVARASTEFSSIETYAGWAWSRGVRLLPDSGDPDPGTVEQGVADLIDVLRATGAPDLTTRDYAAVGDLVAQGRAAMMFDTSAWGFFFEDPRHSQVAGRMGYTTLAGPAASAQFLYAEGLGVTSWSRSPVEAAAFVAWRQSDAVLRAEVLDVGRFDVPRVDLWETQWYADAVRQRALDGYLAVVRRSWDEADIAHVARRPDFVPQARRLMTAIAAVVDGRRIGLKDAVSAVFREADRG
jgi:sorbitol/mannitol transport system substrate-binding protein